MVKIVEVKATGCPYLFWSSYKEGWYYKSDFYVHGEDACKRKACGKESCHAFGKGYSDYWPLLGAISPT